MRWLTVAVAVVTLAGAALACDAATWGHLGAQLAAVRDNFDVLLIINPSGLYEAYMSANALTAAIFMALALAAYSFEMGEATGNHSSVDRLWSIVPAVYAWHFYLASNGDPRTMLMAVLVSLWGSRLTYNFARKGGYSGEEDYRWPYLREIISNKYLFSFFNLTFIATYQHLLLLAIVLPAYVCAECARAGEAAPLGPYDYAATAVFLALLALETAADQQQWNFQQHKKALRASRQVPMGDYKLGFLTSGLFAYSRHPNFFAEQSIWWTFYAFAAIASNQPFHWSITGTALLTMLFQGSTPFTEWITLKRYPLYAKYQQTTSRLIPWFPGEKISAK